MQRIIIKRDKRIASAVLPYWIITGISKEVFMQQYGLKTDLCEHKWNGQAISRVDIRELDMIGKRIYSGEAIEMLIDTSKCSFFACSADGSLSNEVTLGENASNPTSVLLTTKGGWTTASYPFFKLSIRL